MYVVSMLFMPIYEVIFFILIFNPYLIILSLNPKLDIYYFLFLFSSLPCSIYNTFFFFFFFFFGC